MVTDLENVRDFGKLHLMLLAFPKLPIEVVQLAFVIIKRVIFFFGDM